MSTVKRPWGVVVKWAWLDFRLILSPPSEQSCLRPWRCGVESYNSYMTRIKGLFAPDVIWSDQGPQFTSKMFIDFAKQWGFLRTTSSPTYPQSNGKIKATVNSMKKLIRTSWMRNCLDDSKLAQALLQHHVKEMAFHRHKSSLADQCKTRSQLTTEPSSPNGKGVQKKLTREREGWVIL